MLVGGYGSDTLDGQGGEDVLLDGRTSYDYNDAALASLMNEWERTDRSHPQRVTALRSGVGPNGAYRLDGTTTAVDYYVDKLTGGPDRDWFWAQNQWILSVPGFPPVPPRDVLTDWVALSLPGQPDTSERLN
jgi:Ca2+-binding RTX toxin-like protein